MITLQLNKHDFLYAVEGFARGSHLRQHVWRDIVFNSMPQMSDDDMDFLWFYLRRDGWGFFIREGGNNAYGADDFLHAMAALHRGNRHLVTFVPTDGDFKGEEFQAMCYRFRGEYRPLYMQEDGEKEWQRFENFIPNDWVKTHKQLPMPTNRYVEQGKEQWWNDLTIYEK